MRPLLWRVVLASALFFSSVGFAARADKGANIGWPTYGFTYANTRHFDSNQINSSNVSQLVPVWHSNLGYPGKMEVSPIVIGRTIFVTTGGTNEVIALDGVTGEQKWHYTPELGPVIACCAHPNRGVAVSDGRVFEGLLDGSLIALSADTGRLLWKVQVGSARDGFSETMAPLAWGGMVFIGSSGGDNGVRGSFTAYRAANGKLLWRWYTVGPGWEGSYVNEIFGHSLQRDIAQEKRDAPKYRNAWMHAGGAVWTTPALDPARATIYLTTANPSPDYWGVTRPGDNLYTDSIVALDARGGRMKWFYQETPHDVWDYDASSPAILIDAKDRLGKTVPAIVQAGKTGWVYIVNRSNGKLIRVSQAFVPQSHIFEPLSRTAKLIEPGGLGGSLGPAAYDPSRHLVFVAAMDRPEIISRSPPATWNPYPLARWVGSDSPWAGHSRSFLCAVDVGSGKVVWKRELASLQKPQVDERQTAGPLSLADLVFVPDPNGNFYAFRASDGNLEWQYRMRAPREGVGFLERLHDWILPFKRWLFRELPPEAAAGNAPAIAYEVDGRLYVAVVAGVTHEKGPGEAVLYTFALPAAR